MIILDTHAWIWHVQGDKRLKPGTQKIIQGHEYLGIGVSAISLWEVAKAVEYGGLNLPVPVEDWLHTAVSYPGAQVLPLTVHIATESTQLPGHFHNDPADQIIVATARVHDCALITYDSKILKYKHVKLIKPI